MEVLAATALIVGLPVGLYAMGFAAGLAWFVALVLLALIFWPLAIMAAGAIAVYGVLRLARAFIPRVSIRPGSR